MKLTTQTTVLSGIIAVCLTVIVLFGIYTGGQHRTAKRSFQTGRDTWQVEYAYFDCWVVEKYEVMSRDFIQLYPSRTAHEAVRRWNLEHRDDTEALPPAGHVLLPAARPSDNEGNDE